MNRSAFLAVDRMPLVGARLCLDFVNTTGNRGSQEERERLLSYRDLLVWSRRAWILGRRDEIDLAREADRRPVEAAAALDSARVARELLYRIFSSVLERREPAAREMDRLNRLLVEAAGRRGLVATARGIRWRWRIRSRELDRMLWPVVQSAADLLTSPDAGRLKRCGECDWMFVDESRNGRRLWCKKACGDRVKSRRYYRRRRA